MTVWALLAPGPSITQEQADKVRHLPTGAVSCAYTFAPWCRFIAASDAGWWRHYPAALEMDCEKVCMGDAKGTERVRIPWSGNHVNSGVVALEWALRKGATTILLAAGFDMHGTHFFGEYTNGLRNTIPLQRDQHHQQYKTWWAMNRKKVRVINCTEGSALECFPKASLETCLAELTPLAE